MSLKNKDLQGSSSDVVKSQLSSAYQDGITGYGDRPDETEILEPDYSFHVNDLENYSEVGSTDGSVNKKSINKVASIQIDNKEIERIKDKLNASYLENNIEAQIISMIITCIQENGTDTLKNQFANVKNKCQQEVDEGLKALILASQLFHSINMYEMTLAKGNLLKNVPSLINSTEPWVTLLHMAVRSPDSIDPFVLYNTSLGQDNDAVGSKVLSTDIIQKLMWELGTLDRESIENKTVTTLMNQMFAIAENSIDYGVSERFFKKVLADQIEEEDGSSDYGEAPGKSEFTQPTAALCFKPTMSKVYSPTSGDGPLKLKDIFSNNEVGNVGPQSRCDTRVNMPASEASAIFQGSNPPDAPTNRLPNFAETLEPKDQIIYLSSIICRELTLSRGIAKLSGIHKDEFHRATGYNLDSTIYTSDQKNSLPFCRINDIPIGRKLFGPSATVGISQIPTHYKSLFLDPDQSPLHSLTLRPHPNDPSQGFMPLEVLPTGDTELMHLVGLNSTLKSVVTEKLYENPSNPQPYLKIHSDYLEDLEHITGASTIVMKNLNQIICDDTPDGQFKSSNMAGKLVRKVLRDLGTMIIDTQLPPDLGSPQQKTKASQAVADLTALTKFFKPNSIASNDQKFIKSDFLRRMILVDLMRGASNLQTPAGGYEFVHSGFQPSKAAMGIKAPEGDLGYYAGIIETFKTLSPSAAVSDNSNWAAAFTSNYFAQLDPLNQYQYETGGQRMYSLNLNNAGEEVNQSALGGLTQGATNVDMLTNALFRCTSDTNPQITSVLNQSDPAGTPALSIIDDTFDAAGGSSDTSLNGKAGLRESFGHSFINHVWGSGKPSVQATTMDTWGPFIRKESLMSRILETAAHLQEEAGYDQGSVKKFAAAGVTTANGMDKADLLSFILEIYSILANDLLKGVFVPSAMSTSFNHIFGKQDGLSFTAQYHHDFENLNLQQYNTGFKHYYGVAPKISNVNIYKSNTHATQASTNANDQELNHISMEDFGKYLIGIGDEFKINLSSYREDNFAYWAMQTLQNQFGSSKAQEIADHIVKPASYDYKAGSSISLRGFHEIFREQAYEASSPIVASSGAFEILGYIRSVYTTDPFDYDNSEFDQSLISFIKTKLQDNALEAEVFENFMKTGSQNQVVNALIKLGEIASSFSNQMETFPFTEEEDVIIRPGVDLRPRSREMVSAANYYLDYIKNSDDDFIEFTFFGVTHKAHKNEIIKKVALDANTNSNDAKNIKYDFSFIKNSEFYPEIQITRNHESLKDLHIDLGIFVSYQKICEAINGSGPFAPATDFLDLVYKTEFCKFPFEDHKFVRQGYEFTAGSKLINEGEDQGDNTVRKKLENILSSKLMTFIFERLTGFPVLQTNLPEKDSKSISTKALRVFLEGLKVTNLNMDFDVNNVIAALFDPNPHLSVTVGDQALVFTSDNVKLKKALSPTLVRENGEAKFKDPLVSEDLFLAIQAILKSNYILQNSINEIVMTPSIFDVVIGINTSNLHKGNSYNTSPSMEEASSPSAKDILNQLKAGEMKIDNYRAIVKRSVSKE